METVSENRSFGGVQGVYKHASEVCACDMTFSVYVPPAAESGPVPVVYYLSGLTCTQENFTVKAGAQRMAAECGMIVVAPDTSPRGPGVANDEAYDLGQGAGFYVDATQEPWAPHFQMYSYITKELPKLVEAEFPVRAGARGIFGHSMGGHGALTIAMRNPEIFTSVSAFSPIVAPTKVPWGQKAFTAYLGPDESTWAQHDACELVRARGFPTKILVDQGDADGFLDEQLQTHRLIDACKAAGQSAKIRMQPGYDHSYFFISTFMEDHLRHHARILNGVNGG
ncbi:S-formylglutathione hydrolase [Breoghania sp. L-A4]|uniref:S-formylglutathione hydrolase n=1 Tax=Breoghania sp. L-A4 TaxID=2304600 RepID=UPI000E35EAD1|nr:S-formylglutathione hydrolase [Breoghania sp. L-A4]AXS39757.1 S-formylglutathione hydrolase [Breoghania sp. L-A4]